MRLKSLLSSLVLFTFFAACKSEKKPLPEKKSAVVLEEVVEKKVEKIAPKIDYDTSEWIEIKSIIPDIVIDLKYASADNFVEEQMYDCPRCFCRPEVGAQLKSIQQLLKKKGLGLKMYDCYRPSQIQQKLWNKVPNPSYVTPPKRGSMHNRGLAVDIAIVDSLGVDLDFGTAFDFFGPRAHHTYTNLPKEVLENRTLLKETMESHGFRSIRTEWWHYSFPGVKYPLSKMEWLCDH